MDQKATAGTDSIIQQVIDAWREVPGVEAIGLGGSRSIGTALPGSDYDVIIFCASDETLDKEAAQRTFERLGGNLQNWRGNLAEFSISGRKVELFFRSLDRIQDEIEHARKGEFRRTINALHVIGFLSTVVVSYLTYIRPLWDPQDRLKDMIASALPYPEPLRVRMIQTFRTEAKLALIHAGKVRSVNDVGHLLGLYSRTAAAWLLVLFAANRQYPIIDKGGRQLALTFPAVPENFDFRSKAIFRAAAAGDLKGAREEANRLHAEVSAIAQKSGRLPPADSKAESAI